jgi:DNA-binding XRE family transcriptional regulator
VAEQTEPQRRRAAVARFEYERGRALAGQPSALKAARLNYRGAGISTQALAILSGISRETIRQAERDPSSVSAASLRRLAGSLGVPVRRIAP